MPKIDRFPKYEQLYSGIDGVGALMPEGKREGFASILAQSADPKEASARMVNATYLKEKFGSSLPDGWQKGGNWSAVKRQYAKQVHGVEGRDMSDVELYGVIGESIKKERSNRDSDVKMYQAVTGDAVDGELDWMASWKANAGEYETPADRDRSRKVARAAFHQMQDKIDPHRSLIGLGQKWMEEMSGDHPVIGGDEKWMEDMMGNMTRTGSDKLRAFHDDMYELKESVVDGLLDLPEADRDFVLMAIVGRALKTVKQDTGADGGLGDKIGKTIGRGIDSIFIGAKRFEQRLIQHRTGIDLGAERLDMRRKLEQALEGTVDPVVAKGWLEKMMVGAAGSLPYMAVVSTGYGLPIAIASMAEDSRGQLIDLGVPEDEAQKIGLVSGVIQAGIERFQAKMVFRGKLPFEKYLAKWLNAPVLTKGQMVKRMAGVGGVQLAGQNAEEAMQDMTTPILQEMASWLTESVPDVKWDDELSRFKDGRADTFLALFPLVLLGTGVATFKDAAFGREYLSNRNRLVAVGLSQESATKVLDAPTVAAMQEAFIEGYQDHLDNRAEMRSEDEYNRAIYADVIEGNEVHVEKNEDGSFTVLDADGEIIDVAADADTAAGIVADFRKIQDANVTEQVVEMVEYFEQIQEEGSSIEYKPEISKTLQDRVDAGEMTQEEAEGMVDLYVSLGRLDSGMTPAGVSISGENVVTKYDARTGIFKDVSTVYATGTPMTVIEEHAEGYLKRRLADGSVDVDQLAAWRENVEQDGRKNVSKRELMEWFSEQSQAYMVGQANESVIPESFRRFLRKLREYVAKIMEHAARLDALDKAGKLDGGFKLHLARSVGLDASFIEQQARAEAQSQMEETGVELTEWIKGKLPHFETARQKGDPLAGELEDFFKGMKNRQAATHFFAKKGEGADLDKVAEEAREAGFEFDTPADLLAALDDSLRGIPVYAQGGMDAQQSFSLADVSLPDVNQLEDLEKRAKSLFSYETNRERLSRRKIPVGEIYQREKRKSEAPQRSMAEVGSLMERGIHARDRAVDAVNSYLLLHAKGKKRSLKYPRTFADLESDQEVGLRAFYKTGIPSPEFASEVLDAIEEFNKGGQFPDAVAQAIGPVPYDPTIRDSFALESTQRAKEIHARMRERSMSARVAAGVGEFDAKVQEALTEDIYQIVPNKVTVKEALDVVREVGVAEAKSIVLSNTSEYTPNVKVVMGLALMEHFNSQKDFWSASEVGERVSEVGTELGRGVQVFALLGRVLDTPEKAQIFLARQLKKEDKNLREKQPAIDAAVDVLADVKAEAWKIFSEWIDEINAVPKRRVLREPVRIEDFPDITFSLRPDIAKSGIVSFVAERLRKSGIAATEAAMVERYGEKVNEHLKDIIIAAQKANMKPKFTVKPKKEEKANKEKGDSKEEKANKQKKKDDKTRQSERPSAMTPEAVDAALDEIRAQGNKFELQDEMTRIDEHFRGNRMTDAEVDETLAAARAMGLIESQNDLAGLEGFVDRLVAELVSKLKVRSLETPVQIRDAVKGLFEKYGLEVTVEQMRKAFAEKFKIPTANFEQHARISELAQNIASTPDLSAERVNATVDMMTYIDSIMGKIDVVDKVWAIWYDNILSGYITHFKNMWSNFGELVIGLPLDALRLSPGDSIGLLGQMRKGAVTGVKIGWKEAWNQLQTGEASSIKSDEGKFQTSGTLERHRFAGGSKNPYNYLKYQGRALRAEDLFAFSTAQEAKARMVAWEMANGKRLKGEAMALEIERLLNNTEEQIGDFAERARRDWEKLTPELQAKRKVDAWQARRIAELRVMERDANIIERGSEFAARMTFNYQPDGVIGVIANVIMDGLSAFQKIESRTPLEIGLKLGLTAPRLFVAFVRIVANVLNRLLDYGGLGLIRGLIPVKASGTPKQGFKWKAKTRDETSMELKRGMFGLLLMSALAFLADPEDEEAQIQIHGPGSGSREKNQALNGPAWMPYSIEFRRDDGTSRFVTYKYSPMAIALAILGTWHDSIRYKKLHDKEAQERLALSLTGVGHVILDQSFLASAADFMNMFGRDGRVSAEAFFSTVNRTLNPANIVVPFANLVRQVARDFDPVKRDRGSIRAALIAGVPVVERFNKPSLDVLGDEMENRFGDWFTRSEEAGTPESRIYRVFGDQNITPTSTWTYKGQMEPGMFYDFQKERGAELKRLLLEDGGNRLNALASATQEEAEYSLLRLSTFATKIAKSRVGYKPEAKD